MVVRASGDVLERDLERHFSNTCKKLGLITLKLNVRYTRGWPDRVVVLPDKRVLWVELKTLTGKVSALQARVHLDLNSMRHDVLILRTKQEITDALMDAARISKESS